MEYVIAQNSKNGKKSPLVLSEFMGISATMADALQVNPWDLGVRVELLPFSAHYEPVRL